MVRRWKQEVVYDPFQTFSCLLSFMFMTFLLPLFLALPSLGWQERVATSWQLSWLGHMSQRLNEVAGTRGGPESAGWHEYPCDYPRRILTKWPWISYLASLGFILLTHKIRFCYSTNTSNMKCNMKVKDNNTSPTCFREPDKHWTL